MVDAMRLVMLSFTAILMYSQITPEHFQQHFAAPLHEQWQNYQTSNFSK